MKSTYDIVVIGAGIAGASLSASLAATAKVLLLEREQRPGMHSTGRSAAMFHLTYGGPRVQPLSAAALELFGQLDPQFWPNPVLSPRGMVMVACEQGQEALAQQVAQSSGALIPITTVEAQARFPLLRPQAICAAAIDDTGQDIDVDALHQGYLRQFAARGGTLSCNAAVTGISRSDPDWVLAIGSDRVSAPLIVNAAGAWGDQVAQLAGVRQVGLQPKLRTAALIEAPDNSSHWPMLIDSLETFYVKPDTGRFILSPADETDVVPHDAAADDMTLAEGAERMATFIDWEVRKKPMAWAGLRTFSPDRVPVIGFEPNHEGFFWLVGQGGFGVQSAAGVAALAAHLIAPETFNPPSGIDPLHYAPARFRRAA
jgi:D-arginine dehydrogenase